MSLTRQQIQSALELAVRKARRNDAGHPASYIPQLARVPLEAASVPLIPHLIPHLCVTETDAP